ncbi:MAG: 4-(cytidine 5'-diphospho)-2-C-methyl-D-erythritol kinase [Nitrococcus mobilis]|nr:4-(cytidine 5'-diphospho)-2-C-methyl-D-erythritol kinase [Nitrococcus mobilis]
MNSAAWPAPAKINRFLHVVGRRDDGYHLLQTLFQFLDMSDWLYFTRTTDGRVCRVGDVPGVSEAADLSVRAAQLLQEVTGCACGAVIRLDKRLPTGGGLGGGSSDAATTLVALNEIWDTGLGEDALADLGLRLGADVPVFVRGRAAWGEGIGERLVPVRLDEPWFLVVDPGVTVATQRVFQAPELTRNSPRITINGFYAGGVRNDCEPIVRRLYPEIGRALDWLEQFGAARLTGTGACIFAPFAQEHLARGALERLPRRWRGWVVRGRNHSPLLRRRRFSRSAGRASRMR